MTLSELDSKEPSKFSQSEFRQKMLIAAGSIFLDTLRGYELTAVTNVFASKDEKGLQDLIGIFDAPTVEAIAYSLDDAMKGFGEESSYHEWTTGITHGQPESPAAGAQSGSR